MDKRRCLAYYTSSEISKITRIVAAIIMLIHIGAQHFGLKLQRKQMKMVKSMGF